MNAIIFQHLEILKNELEELNLNIPIVIYKGNMGKKKVKEFKQTIEDADKQNKSRIIVATSTSIVEGFDDSRFYSYNNGRRCNVYMHYKVQ